MVSYLRSAVLYTVHDGVREWILGYGGMISQEDKYKDERGSGGMMNI